MNIIEKYRYWHIQQKRHMASIMIFYLDPIYEVLYTRKGRFKLLKYLLKRVGVERLPECWER